MDPVTAVPAAIGADWDGQQEGAIVTLIESRNWLNYVDVGVGALGVVATFAAVWVALHLARRDRQVVLRMNFERIEQVIATFGRPESEGEQSFWRKNVCVRVINLNRTPAYLLSSLAEFRILRRYTHACEDSIDEATVPQAEGKVLDLNLEKLYLSIRARYQRPLRFVPAAWVAWSVRFVVITASDDTFKERLPRKVRHFLAAKLRENVELPIAD